MIRRATEEDADTLADILRSAMNGAMPSLSSVHSPDEDRWFLREIVLPTNEVWVAEHDGRVVGFTALGTRDGIDFMEHIYVAPEEQGLGIGSGLMERAKQRRPEGFRLWVFQANRGARRFYERRGLRLIALTDGVGTEDREPDALYEWLP
jgi:ribosomal protein S18 acetylase RimI-like enzyme